MAGFIDVLLRGLTLVMASVALGGVAWTRLVLGAAPDVKPDAAARLALRVVALAAFLLAASQAAVALVALAELGRSRAAWPLAAFAGTTFARTAALRVALGLVLGAVALRLAAKPAGRGAWLALGACGLALVGASAVLSHAVARVGDRAVLLVLDAAHQLAAAVWVGGLAHLTLYAARAACEAEPERVRVVAARFSSLALASVVALTAAGVSMTAFYVGGLAVYLGTAYGVMILSKAILFVAALALATANFRAARAAGAAGLRLARYVEVELGLGLTVLFAAASLTSLPPAVDVSADRASVAEVAARFVPAPPRLTSPPVSELIARAEPLMGPVTRREPIEIAWSEYNHHWAGLFVLAMGLLVGVERLGLRSACHWPLLFLGLAAFLFARNDPRAWPLGPAGFWESMTLPDVLQHRAFVLLIVAFGVFEWMVRTARLPARPWAHVFPLLCAAGGGLLMTHSHAMLNLKQEFLTEVTHAPLGVLGVFAGWGRWLELRLPAARRAAGWLWTWCFIGVGLFLLFYREG
jgi:putative copper resistance protein D